MATTIGGVNGGANPENAVDITPDGGFTPAQIQSIAAIIVETIRQERQHDNNHTVTVVGEEKEMRIKNQTPETPTLIAMIIMAARVIRVPRTGISEIITHAPNEIGLFWPDLPESYGYDEIVDADWKTIYRSAFAFANRLRVASQTRSIRKMVKNLELCLRGAALRWWNYELSNTTRQELIYADTIEDWCEAVEKRFQLPPSQARERLNRTRYTVADIRNRVPPSTYVSTVLSLARQCGEASEFGVVLYAWRNMNIELRSNIPEPKEGITIQRFIRDLQQWETNW
ncbi:hypothetical protein BDW67DRAFT_189480 [Aspergillus spinulosporus]